MFNSDLLDQVDLMVQEGGLCDCSRDNRDLVMDQPKLFIPVVLDSHCLTIEQ